MRRPGLTPNTSEGAIMMRRLPSLLRPGRSGRPRRSTALLVGVLMATALVGLAETSAAHAAGDVITVTFSTPQQPAYQFQGFGTSLAWWANVVGGWPSDVRSQIEDALFGTADFNNPNRLGLNVIRYNIGASPTVGSNPPTPDLSMLPSNCHTWPAGGGGRAVPVVQPGPGQPIDLSLDANQIQVLTDAISRVQAAGERPALEAFANSAPWWMTVDHCPQGDGSIAFPIDNLTQTGTLQPYSDYAQFLVSVLKAFRDQEGITFGSVEPLNEPSDSWVPGINGGQEGMLINRAGPGGPGSPGPQALVIGALCSALHDAQLSTTVAAPDGFNPDGTSSTPIIVPPDNTLADLSFYPQSTRDCLSKINTHMYDLHIPDLTKPFDFSLNPYAGTGRRALAAAAANLSPGQPPKRIWVSEYGNGGAGTDIMAGTTLSNEIARDLRYLRPSAWVYWQSVEAPGGWGLIEDPGFPGMGTLGPNFPNAIDANSITPTKRFFALEQYSRFIHPGDWIVSTSDPQVDNVSAEQASTVGAFDPTAGTLTIVTTNDTGSPRTPTYDLSTLAPALTTGNVDVFRTDSTLNAQPDAQTLQLTDGQFTDTQQPHSINTYVIGLPGLPPVGFPSNLPPVVNAGPPVTGNETDSITLSGSASDPDGDPLRIQWSASQPTGTTDPGASCTFADPTAPQTTITCSDEGTYRLTLTADDGVNLPVSSSTTVTVNNLGPSIAITQPPPWQQFQAPAAVSLTAPITDPGANDTHTCTINWDDGSPPETFAHGGNCDRTHTFTAPGVYTVTVTVTDDDQRTASASDIVVVVDPTAGFVTGGGWIDSPPGAYTPDPSVGGKVHFTMQAKYPAGATTPTGNISVRIQDIHLDMDAGSLDWLVVSPNGEAAVKGSGTLGGQDVRFILYGYQGCGGNPAPGCQPGSDRFRAVIWPAAQGATPTAPFIYDNVPGADLELADANPQPLGGGNIQLHS